MTLPTMSRANVRLFLIAVAYLGVAGCATVPTEDRARIVNMPLASTHADIAFSMTTGRRQNASCDDDAHCATFADRKPTMRFALQVQRIAGALQKGAQDLYPDLQQRVPQLVGGRFDIYVVDGDQLGSASSADGRIALQAGLRIRQPYDDWIAFVIAREMGHVIARHHEENSAASIATSVIMNILIPGSGLLKTVITAGGSNIAAKSQRDAQVLEADAIALKLLEVAGFELRDIGLALRIAPVLLDDGQWAKDFRVSSDRFLGAVSRSRVALAAGPILSASN